MQHKRQKMFLRASGRSAATGFVLALSMSASASDTPQPQTPTPPQSQSHTQSQPKPSAKASGKARWFQVGKASWYGRAFQGRRTAMGEKFDMNLMTCAHRTLPLGSWVRVTNLRNRKSVFLRVNDRGPMVEGRIVDLSYAAAQLVGLAGLERVSVESVPAPPLEIARNNPDHLPPPTGY